MTMLLIFSTAPEIYDLPATRPAGHVGFTADGQEIRAVEVDMRGAVVQVRRYLTAGYVAVDGAGLEEIVRLGGHVDRQRMDPEDDWISGRSDILWGDFRGSRLP
jgi:hypothetical protein